MLSASSYCSLRSSGALVLLSERSLRDYTQIGFVNLGEISNQLLELEHLENGEMKQCVATNMLVFMVRNLFSKLEYPYARFPCASLSGDLIFPLVWDCVKRLESYGFKVMALTADGASCNRNFFKMHKPGDDSVYKTVNVFSKERRPIFFSDVPHLIKTVRNCWANSFGHRVLEVHCVKLAL